jgi:hypothetical protein
MKPISMQLRRALIAAGAVAALLAGAPSAAQTITLSGSTSATCTWSAFTMQPNGAISVTCSSGSVGPDPNVATFTLTGPSSVVINTYPDYRIKRTGGPAGQTVLFSYAVTGVGCGWMSQGPFALAINEEKALGVFPVALGACRISFGVQEGHSALPATKEMNITVVSSIQEPPPPPPPDEWSQPVPVVVGCPAAPVSSRLRKLDWGSKLSATPFPGQEHLHSGMNSGEVMAIKIPQSPTGRASVTLAQTPGSATPAAPTMDLTISRCPGVIEENLPQPVCFNRTTFSQFHAVTAYNRALPGKPAQSDYYDGCLIPSTTEQYYVNVRWTFASCPWGDKKCGFSLQWDEGPN